MWVIRFLNIHSRVKNTYMVKGYQRYRCQFRKRTIQLRYNCRAPQSVVYYYFIALVINNSNVRDNTRALYIGLNKTLSLNVIITFDVMFSH